MYIKDRAVRVKQGLIYQLFQNVEFYEQELEPYCSLGHDPDIINYSIDLGGSLNFYDGNKSLYTSYDKKLNYVCDVMNFCYNEEVIYDYDIDVSYDVGYLCYYLIINSFNAAESLYYTKYGAYNFPLKVLGFFYSDEIFLVGVQYIPLEELPCPIERFLPAMHGLVPGVPNLENIPGIVKGLFPVVVSGGVIIYHLNFENAHLLREYHIKHVCSDPYIRSLYLYNLVLNANACRRHLEKNQYRDFFEYFNNVLDSKNLERMVEPAANCSIVFEQTLYNRY